MLVPALEHLRRSRRPEPELVLQSTRCPKEQLEAIDGSCSELARASAARHPSTSAEAKRRFLDDRSAIVQGLAHDGLLVLDPSPASKSVRFWTLFDGHLDRLWVVDALRSAAYVANLAAEGALVESPGENLAPFLVDAVALGTAERVLDVLASHPMSLVAMLVAYRSDPPAAVQRTLLSRRPGGAEKHVHTVLARRTRAPEILELLARSTNEDVLAEVIGNPSCPVSVLEALAIGAPRNRLRALAGAYRLPPAVCRALSGRIDSELAEILSQHPACHASLLDEIIRVTRHSWVGALQHPNVAEETLRHAAKSDDAEVRGLVALNPKTPLDVLVRLAEDEDVGVPFYLVQNPRCTPDLAKKLSYHEDVGVLALAARRELSADRFTELAKREDEKILVEIAQSKYCPSDVLDGLSRDAVERVRLGVARNAAAPAEVTARLAEDADPKIRSAALANPTCPRSVLERAATVSELRSAVANNPKAPVPLLETLAGSGAPGVLAAVAANAACPPALVEQLFRDPRMPEWAVYAIAKNPQAPPAVLEALRGAGKVLVRNSDLPLDEHIELATRFNPPNQADLELRRRLADAAGVD